MKIEKKGTDSFFATETLGRHASLPGEKGCLSPFFRILFAATFAVGTLAAQQIPTGTMPMSSVLSRDGKFLLVLNAGVEPPSISVIATAEMKETARVPVPDAWLGLAYSPDQRFVYVGGGARNTVFELTWNPSGELKYSRELGAGSTELAASLFVGDVTVSTDGRKIYAADLFHDAIVVIDAQSGKLLDRYRAARRPYRILLHPDGRSYFVTSWTEGVLVHYEITKGGELSRLRLGPHTTDLILSDRKIPDDESGTRYRLFVTASNTNNVFVVGLNDAQQMSTLQILNIGLSPAQPAGMTPSALALSPDQTRLFVVCSDANAVAAVDISELRGSVAGFIPTAAYPLAARVLPDSRLAILNGSANTVSIIPPLDEDTLGAYTRNALNLSEYLASDPDRPQPKPAPIQNVILILKNQPSPADPNMAPNHAKLAREFVTFENFQSSSRYSHEGLLWAVAGIVPDFTARLWARRPNAVYEGGEPANLPPAGYLWSNARTAGLTVRNYGVFVENRPQAAPDGSQIARVTDPSLNGITSLKYRGPDPAYPDLDRARVFVDELAQMQALPRLTLLRLSDDAAIGQAVEAVSKTRFWPQTAIFVMATGTVTNRSQLLAISPYFRRGVVDSNVYNTNSVLRTIELLLDLKPMTQFDAGARPLTAPFAATPNPAPYTAVAR